MAKIFFLEDEETLGEMYVKKFKAAGHTVLWEKTAVKALSTIERFIPEVAVIDHSIRGQTISGLDIIPHIRHISPHTKIAMLSNYSPAQLEQEAKLVGADEYFLKIQTPPSVLLKKLEYLIAKRAK